MLNSNTVLFTAGCQTWSTPGVGETLWVRSPPRHTVKSQILFHNRPTKHCTIALLYNCKSTRNSKLVFVLDSNAHIFSGSWGGSLFTHGANAVISSTEPGIKLFQPFTLHVFNPRP